VDHGEYVMISANPFGQFRKGCTRALEKALGAQYAHILVPSFMLEPPPDPRFGELSSTVCFELAKQTAAKPSDMAKKIAAAIDVSPAPLVESAEAAGEGYINFHANLAELSSLTLESARTLSIGYGCLETDRPTKIIVEHTSANPTSPIHIGQARNPVLGDALARILKAGGHTVSRHYYIDDVGRQMAVIAYGYAKLGKPKPDRKPDHFIGVIYAITNCLIEIQRLKKEIQQAKEQATTDELAKLQQELDNWASAAADLEGRFPQLFSQLLEEIKKDEDPRFIVDDHIRRYESGDEPVKQSIREVCELCLQGYRETLDRGKIQFDSWDWESDFVWNSDVQRILNRLKKTPYVFQVGGVLEFDADKVAEDLDLKGTLGLREGYEVPTLTLVRSDGTTLYTTRDIPYTFWKFERADRVINVVGMDQTLAQLHLKLALCALGALNLAERLVHFAYNLVSLPGYRMESRTGRYVTFDEVLDKAIDRAYDEVSKRSPTLAEEEKRRISQLVGIGAVKYALVEVDPMKPVVFTWDRVLDFEKNSAPYIQYSHARACSILRKAAREPENPDYSLMTAPLERGLVIMLARFPEVFTDIAEDLKPNGIADFVNALADKFNAFYTALPVIKAKPRELSDSRLALVDATRIAFRNCLNLLGIVAPERM